MLYLCCRILASAFTASSMQDSTSDSFQTGQCFKGILWPLWQRRNPSGSVSTHRHLQPSWSGLFGNRVLRFRGRQWTFPSSQITVHLCRTPGPKMDVYLSYICKPFYRDRAHMHAGVSWEILKASWTASPVMWTWTWVRWQVMYKHCGDNVHGRTLASGDIVIIPL